MPFHVHPWQVLKGAEFLVLKWFWWFLDFKTLAYNLKDLYFDWDTWESNWNKQVSASEIFIYKTHWLFHNLGTKEEQTHFTLGHDLEL